LPPDFVASDTAGCDSLKVKFSLVNVDTDTISSILWDFGDVRTTSIDPDSVVFRAGVRPAQTYSVQVVINGDTENAVEKTDFITIHRSVRASFECVDSLRTENSIIKVCYNLDHLFDTSAIYGFEWRLEGFTPTNDIRPLYTFANEADTLLAELTITDSTYGCSDTRTQRIFIIPELPAAPIQNVFTPNGDGVNEYFIIDTDGLVDLQIRIFSRSGLLVYEAEGSEIVWDGKSPSGVKLESGIYYYVLSSLSGDPDGKYNTTGFVYLLR
jgi:gliding motility-associated-like protein